MLPYAALVQWSGAYRLWQGQAVFNDPHADLGHAAACGFRVPTGIGVTLMPYRHPLQAALQAQALAVTTGHPVLAGYGPGAASLQRALLGAPYRSQLGASREYLTVLRSLLAGEELEYAGEYFSCHGELPAIPRPPVELGLGVLRPGMARLAGEVADAAITWLTPAAYLREVVVPALRDGARVAGRRPPRLVAMVPLAVAGPDRDAAELAGASNAMHLRLPHYADMLRRAGIRVDHQDPAGSAAALVAGGAFLYGDPDDLAKQLSEFADAGVDEVVLNLAGVGARYGAAAALREFDTILGVVAP
jgi:alkanesulfonate monooxygenase SsuD/methylene tetrahydromethanopterin reductase-like flavin-dependent oxidoreductase (luciferase family)